MYNTKNKIFFILIFAISIFTNCMYAVAEDISALTCIIPTSIIFLLLLAVSFHFGKVSNNSFPRTISLILVIMLLLTIISYIIESYASSDGILMLVPLFTGLFNPFGGLEIMIGPFFFNMWIELLIVNIATYVICLSLYNTSAYLHNRNQTNEYIYAKRTK